MTTDLDNLPTGADGENELNLNPEENQKETDQNLSENQSPEKQPVEEAVNPEAESSSAEDESPKTEEVPSETDQNLSENENSEEPAEETVNSEAETSSTEEEIPKAEEVPSETDQNLSENQNPEEQPVEETVNLEAEISSTEEESPKTEEISSESEQSEINSEKTEDYKHEEAGGEAAEEAEEEEEEQEQQIPFKNYDELPLPVLIGEAKELLRNHPARVLKEHFNQIRDSVKKLLDEDEIAKKEAYVEDGGDALDFQYDNPAKKEFNRIYGDYRNQLDLYFKEQEKAQQENLTERLQIIEELKSLYQDPNDDNSNIFSKFRKLKTRWHNAGMVPKSQAGNVFKTYFHHLDNFYRYLDLNKELREMDYSHNLEVRSSIIKRAEQLVEEENVQKALNELQYLHKLWKEEAVPVAEEMREPTWQRFKELTLKIHERKIELGEKIKEEQEENLKKKEEVLALIRKLYNESNRKSHGDWQNCIKKLNKLREEFIAIGRVPREYNQKMWDEFKAATREFNHKKNEFYKYLKTEQQQNLAKKEELLRIAKEHSESTDWDKSVQIIKKIQSDWKKIGHVPRKQSDKIWKEFKEACNKFFDNYKTRTGRVSQEFEQNLVKKEELLAELRDYKTSGDRAADLNKINDFNIRWSSIGKVPAAKMSVNSEFSKIINNLVGSMGLSEDEIHEFRMSALVDRIKSGQDEQMLDDEIRKTKKFIEELEKEINQLETNIGFFTDEKSPLLKNFHKQIEEKRSRLTEAEFKLRMLHRIDFEEEPEKTEERNQNPEDQKPGAGEETAEN